MVCSTKVRETLRLLFLVTHIVGPVLLQDSVGRFGRHPRMRGYDIKSDHFEIWEQIFTPHRCFDCTYIDSAIICILKSCPLVKPLGENCILVKNKNDCCPKIHCPEVHTERDLHKSTHNRDHQVSGCFLNGTHYPDGAMLPSDSDNPCEICYCDRNSAFCVEDARELEIEGCSPIYKPGQCCPSRYICSVQQIWFRHSSSNTTTSNQPLDHNTHTLTQNPTGCQIEGISVRLRQIVLLSSYPCMLCRCEYGGIMICQLSSCKPDALQIEEIAIFLGDYNRPEEV